MNSRLQHETERLTRSWTKHQSAWLRDYLVAGVEDPRINLQSILSRHFLARELLGERFHLLMEEEYRFAAVMNWLLDLAKRPGSGEELAVVLHALQHRADNAEGLPIPQFVLRTFATLPLATVDYNIPNYVESFLTSTEWVNGQLRIPEPLLNTFCDLWQGLLSGVTGTASCSVLEPACGSANDYRFLAACGLARLVHYTGFDLCAKNVENALALFPNTRFRVGNVFAIDTPEKSFDLCVVHDLFEHLSLEGLAEAVHEVCRVTRRGLCVGFFQMDERRDHVVRTMDEYHWNTLSLARVKELFAGHGFRAQAIHVGTFLREKIGCEFTHNANAYTLVLRSNLYRYAHPVESRRE